MNMKIFFLSFKSGAAENIIALSIIIFAVFAVYTNAVNFPFVNFDDPLYVLDNQMVKKGLSMDSLLWAFTDSMYITNFWVPVTWLSFLFDFQIYGLFAGGYHFTNIIFHSLNACLVFALILKISKSRVAAFTGSLLFALHPVHVESVAWVTERKDVLSCFFWLIATIFYLKYCEIKRPKYFFLTLAAVLLGFMSKPIMVTIPFVFLILDFWPAKRLDIQQLNKTNIKNNFRLLTEKVPFFAMSFFFSFFAYYTQSAGSSIAPLSNISFTVKVLNSLISYVSYLKNLALPVNLAAIYPYPYNPSISHALIAIIILAIITYLAIKNHRSHPYIIAGWLWYLGVIFPVIGIVVIGPHAMADRYLYIPAIGIYLIVGIIVGKIYDQHYKIKPFLIVVLCIFFSSLGFAGHRQVMFWKDSETLFRRAISVTKDNVLAYNNLGVELSDQGKTDEAIYYYRSALKIYPDFPDFNNNYALELKKKGDIQGAYKHFNKALENNPNLIQARSNIALMLSESGKTDEAKKHLFEIIKQKPDYIQPYHQLARILLEENEYKKAMEVLSKALDIDSLSAETFNLIGAVFAKTGDLESASKAFTEATKLDPSNILFQQNLNEISKVKDNKK